MVMRRHGDFMLGAFHEPLDEARRAIGHAVLGLALQRPELVRGPQSGQAHSLAELCSDGVRVTSAIALMHADLLAQVFVRDDWRVDSGERVERSLKRAAER